MTITKDVLHEVPLFAGLSDKDLKQLAGSLREKVYGPGEKVVEEGTGGIGFFVILDGKAEVTIKGKHRGEMQAGDYFGELGLLDDKVGRQATVIAEEELHCAAITAWQFKPFLKEHPDVAWSLMQSMARRLADTEQYHTAS